MNILNKKNLNISLFLLLSICTANSFGMQKVVDLIRNCAIRSRTITKEAAASLKAEIKKREDSIATLSRMETEGAQKITKLTHFSSISPSVAKLLEDDIKREQFWIKSYSKSISEKRAAINAMAKLLTPENDEIKAEIKNREDSIATLSRMVTENAQEITRLTHLSSISPSAAKLLENDIKREQFWIKSYSKSISEKRAAIDALKTACPDLHDAR